MNQALFDAITKDDDEDSLEDLLTDLEGKNQDGLTPLQYACNLKAYMCANTLLKAGAKPVVSSTWIADHDSKLDVDDQSLLDRAVYRGAPELAKCLIANGARTDWMSSNGWAAIHYAASSGFAEVCAQLVERGVPVDLKSGDGETPLVLAVEARRPSAELVQWFIDHGADVHVVDQEGNSLAARVKTSIREWRKAILDVLAAHGVKEAPPGPDRTTESYELVQAYVGQKVSAALDGTLFGHVPATFWFFFGKPASLKAQLKDDFEDEVRGWKWTEVVPVGSVSFDDDKHHTVGWLFLDWRKSATSPSVLITTSDTFGDPTTIESLAVLKLQTHGPAPQDEDDDEDDDED